MGGLRHAAALSLRFRFGRLSRRHVFINSQMTGTINKAFGTLADADMWEDGAAALAGFLAPTAVRNVAEGQTQMDLPDEVYGLAVIFGAQYSPAYSGMLTIGGAAYTGDKVLERFGLKQTVTGDNL